MLRAYGCEHSRIREIALGAAPETSLLRTALWIDLQEPEDDERTLVERLDVKELPEAEDVEEIEDSARLFVDGQDIHVHSLYLSNADRRHDTVTVAFILKPDRLLSFRDADLADFRLMRLRTRRGQIEATNPLQILVSLLEQKVENLADTVEDIYSELDHVSAHVLGNADGAQAKALDMLATMEDSNGKIRLCLMDTQRSLSFLMRHIRHSPDEILTCREILRDIESLTSHTTYMFEKINFLMDAALGFINIEQNRIIKIFSIAAVIFLPPTLVASVYGMNFAHMPELGWEWGYPMAVGLMIAAGFAPYWYFKRKGWL